jgi:hypothetical protein
MKVKGLDGKAYTWNLVGYVPNNDSTRPRSSLHKAVRQLLQKLYPLDRILEELPLPGSGGLFIDFFVPGERLVVEAHGVQHYEFVQHFHQNPLGFINAKKRDRRKRDWINLNGLKLVELPYNENEDAWRNRIINCGTETSSCRETDN